MLQRKQGDLLNKEGQEYLAFILGGARKMNDLLGDLQLFTDLASRVKSTTQSIDLKPLLEEVFKKQAEEQGKPAAKLIIHQLQRIKGHPELLSILFEQLFQNALKFDKAEAPEVDVSCQLSGKSYQLQIKDRGVGIEKEYQKQIFDIFQRLDKQHFEGTGIGLAICRRIVELHQGKIWLESTPGQGSTFFVELPAW